MVYVKWFLPSKQTASVVYHYNPTSNRNKVLVPKDPKKLYIIIILHQTATEMYFGDVFGVLYINIILHQTATMSAGDVRRSKLYIIIILHQTATVATIFHAVR